MAKPFRKPSKSIKLKRRNIKNPIRKNKSWEENKEGLTLRIRLKEKPLRNKIGIMIERLNLPFFILNFTFVLDPSPLEAPRNSG